MSAPREIIELVERFSRNAESYRSSHYLETQVRVEFIDPLFKQLGWDIHNSAGFAEAYKDVIHEASLKIGGETQAPDYSFRIGGARKFFLEAKRPGVRLKDDPKPAFQLRRYAWSARLPLSILTDFEEFAVYDCRVKPSQSDKAAAARIRYLTYTEYPEQWDYLVSTFSKDAVLKGSFDKYAESTKLKKGTATVDAAFLKEIEGWRELLAKNIALRNPSISQRELNYAVQVTIDRILFLRMCEDRGIELYGQLQALQNGTAVYPRLRELFRKADERYNSGLFHFTHEHDRPEMPDELTTALEIDDKPLKDIFKSLYYPESPYEFSVLPAEILGQVYEQFLGKVIRLTPNHRAIVEEKPQVRKAGGVYYTPTYIVDYIVKNTVGKLLEGKTPRQASKLKVLDPACGSGSFLLGAFQYLLDWHRDYYVAASTPEKPAKEIFKGRGGLWHLTSAEKKRILLNNIYGVDIDPQAVEVTKLSLLLKVLEGESQESLERQFLLFHERALPDLGSNIKCGNSLIGPDFYDGTHLLQLNEDERRRVNAFDWRAEFPHILNAGGFDSVIGNPPYIFTRELLTSKERDYFSITYEAAWEKHNTYLLFMEQLLRLLNTAGVGGFIVPNSWLSIESAKLLRTLYIPRLELVADLNYTVFDNVSMEPCIFIVSSSTPPELLALRANSEEEFRSLAPFPVPKSRMAIDGRITLDSSANVGESVESIYRFSTSLGTGFDVRTGLQAYEKGKGIPPQTADDVRKHVFDRDSYVDANSVRYLEGKDVCRYALRWSGKWMQYGAWLSQPREIGIFSRPRVLVREITGTFPKCIHATFVAEAFLNNKSILNILHNEDDCDELKTLLCIINSRLMSFFYKQRGVKGARKLFPKIVIKNLREFPLPKLVEPGIGKQLVQLADRMLDLEKIASEVKTSHERNRVQRDIVNTDDRIDALVLKAYGLAGFDPRHLGRNYSPADPDVLSTLKSRAILSTEDFRSESTGDAENAEELDRMNSRRLDLAERRSVGSLTPAEEAEFNELQAAFFAHLETRFPTPRIADGRLEALEEKYNLADTP